MKKETIVLEKEKETIVLEKLTASDGMTLTNGEEYCKKVYLAQSDRAENWYEIADAEADAEAEESDYIAALERFGVK